MSIFCIRNSRCIPKKISHKIRSFPVCKQTEKDRKILFCLFALCVIRIDHKLLDLGPSGIHTHKTATGEQEDEQADHTQRNENCCKPDRQHHKHHATAEHNEIASEAEDRKDRRVFDDLMEFQIEGDHNGVDIKGLFG